MIIPWFLTLPWNYINTAAKENHVDPLLVAAIVMKESRGDSGAVRFEPTYRWLLTPRSYAENLGITEITEETMQKTSWGPMQIIGGTARELGYAGHLQGLSEAKTGMHYGCKYLKKQLLRYETEEDAISAYNAGSVRKTEGTLYYNQRYVDEVYKYLIELRSFLN